MPSSNLYHGLLRTKIGLNLLAAKGFTQVVNDIPCMKYQTQ